MPRLAPAVSGEVGDARELGLLTGPVLLWAAEPAVRVVERLHLVASELTLGVALHHDAKAIAAAVARVLGLHSGLARRQLATVLPKLMLARCILWEAVLVLGCMTAKRDLLVLLVPPADCLKRNPAKHARAISWAMGWRQQLDYIIHTHGIEMALRRDEVGRLLITIDVLVLIGIATDHARPAPLAIHVGLVRPRAAQHADGDLQRQQPERINGEAYSTPSDVWALGLSIMTCALGRIPIKSDAGYWSLLRCVRDDPPPTLPEGGPWSDDFRDLITRCLQKDPAKRATCDELLMHPFVANASRDSEGGGEDGEDGEDDPNVQQMLTEQAVGELMAMLDAVKAHLTRLQSAHRLASLTDLLLANQKERELAAASNGGSVATLQTMQSGTEDDLLTPDVLLHASMSDLLHRRSLRRLADQLNLPQKEVEARVEKYLADLSAGSGGMRMSVAD